MAGITRRTLLQWGAAALGARIFGESDQRHTLDPFERAVANKAERQDYLESRIHALAAYSGMEGLPVIDSSRLLQVEYIESRAEAEWFIKNRTVNDGSFQTLYDPAKQMQTFPAVIDHGRYRIAAPARGVPRQSVLVAKLTAYVDSSPEEFDSVLLHEFAHAAQVWDGTLHFTRAFSLYDLVELDLQGVPDDAAARYSSNLRMQAIEFDGYLVGHRFAKRFTEMESIIAGTKAYAALYQSRFVNTLTMLLEDVTANRSAIPQETLQLLKGGVQEMSKAISQV